MQQQKIYTKFGDTGKTSLCNGVTVSKDNIRVEAYGNIDELNSFVGALRDFIIREAVQNENIGTDLSSIDCNLLTIQNELFNIASEIAFPNGVPASFQIVTEASVIRLESEIDSLSKSLEPLSNFILPGGHILCSMCHICRTVCRRVERSIVVLYNAQQLNRDLLIQYFNRLSNWLFTLARYISHICNVNEVIWKGRK